MIHTPDIDLLPAFEAEIAKAKKRLDVVYSDTENLKKDKSVIENDIIRLQKHVDYLNQVIKEKEDEAERKQKTISGIDNEISTRGLEVEKLRKEEGDIKQILNSHQDGIRDIEEKVKAHKERMSSEADSSEKRLRDASEKHSKAEEKLEKIVNFINSIK